MKRNGYPLRYIDKQIRLFLNKRHKSPIMQKYDTSNNCKSLKTSESKESPLFLRLPYLGNISLQIEKEIRQYLIRNLSTKFRFRLVHDTHNIGKCFKFKDRQTLLHNAGVVYKLNCSCRQSYIGQTHRSFIHAYELMLGLHVFRQTGPPRRVDFLAPPSVCHIKTEASR